MSSQTALATVSDSALASATYPSSDRHPVLVYLASLGSDHSRRAMRNALETVAELLAPGLGAEHLPWHQLRYQHTAAVRSILVERYSPATVNQALAAIRGAIRECWQLGYMTEEQRARVSNLAAAPGNNLPRGRALSDCELYSLFNQSRPRDGAILALLYGCGLRRSELVAIDLEDVDLETATVKILHGKGRKQRVVPIPAGAVSRVRAWLAVRGNEPGPLFWSEQRASLGERLTDAGVFHVLKAMAEKAKVSQSFSPHDLRRTFISALLDRGADIETVRKMAGHSSVQITARYDRRDERAMARAATLLDIPAA